MLHFAEFKVNRVGKTFTICFLHKSFARKHSQDNRQKTSVLQGLGASSRLWELIDRRPSIPVEGGLTPTTPIVGDIAFRNVSFAYPSRAEHDVIKDLKLEVKSDTVLAVVGGSGSGKEVVENVG